MPVALARVHWVESNWNGLRSKWTMRNADFGLSKAPAEKFCCKGREIGEFLVHMGYGGSFGFVY